MKEVVRKLKPDKAPGDDEIPNRIIGLVISRTVKRRTGKAIHKLSKNGLSPEGLSNRDNGGPKET